VAAWPHPSIELAKGRAFRFIGQSGKSAAKSRLEAAEESIEFVGGVEVGLELAGGEFFAKIVEAAGEEIEGRGEDLLVGEDDIAPSGIGASGKAEGIAQAGAGERNREAVFVQSVVKKTGEGNGGQLREMGC